MEKGQREFFLRQQLKAIQDELGEGDADQAELNELRQRFTELDLPEDVQKTVDRELSRLEKIPSAAAEHGVIRTYLDWLVSLPWNKVTDDNLDLDHARTVLDEDHYDLEKVKDRILEHLAVSKLKNDLSGPILCFVGPPGVGKTSLGQSIARAVGRTRRASHARRARLHESAPTPRREPDRDRRAARRDGRDPRRVPDAGAARGTRGSPSRRARRRRAARLRRPCGPRETAATRPRSSPAAASGARFW